MVADGHIYDVIIIGAGPAGMSAGIYAGRAMLDVLILEKGRVGGQVTTTEEIVNYPGLKKTTGAELMQEMYEQIQNFGVQLKIADITSVDFSGDVKVVYTTNTSYQARTVIITTGAQARKIGFPGESEFTGRGVAYCSTCDGEFFKDVPVFVIGGGFAAAEEAVFLTRFASEVTVVVREDDFTCAKATANLAKNHPKVKVLYHTEVKEVTGEETANRIVLVNNQTGAETEFSYPRLGMFVLAGTVPQTALFKDAVNVDERGYIPVSANMETNVSGVYAAGDILPKTLRQIVTAVSDGAIAATQAQHYVAKLREELGLPEVSDEVVARQKAAMATAEKTTKVEVKSGKWFNEKMAQQLQGIFARLTTDVEIRMFLDPSYEKTNDMKSFMEELGTLSEKITVTTYGKGKESKELNVERFPSAVLLTSEKTEGNICFSGIPSGHEVNSLVLAIYNLAGPGQALEDRDRKIMESLPEMSLEICVSLSCHFCPDVVTACQRIASVNPRVKAEMIDAALYPELKDQYKLMSFPTLVINKGEKILYGAQTMSQILDALNELK